MDRDAMVTQNSLLRGMLEWNLVEDIREDQ